MGAIAFDVAEAEGMALSYENCLAEGDAWLASSGR
jgi:hypothetical protein